MQDDWHAWLFWFAVNLAAGLAYDSKINLGIAAIAVAVLSHDWWNRRGRKIAKALGAKSRALLAKLVDSLTPSPVPA